VKARSRDNVHRSLTSPPTVFQGVWANLAGMATVYGLLVLWLLYWLATNDPQAAP